jgi:hypothetical protein
MPREVVLWRRRTHLDKQESTRTPIDIDKKEKTMTTDLKGSASETDLTPAQLEALTRAISLLEPHEKHSTVGGILGKMRGAAGAEDEDATLAKAMSDIHATRVTLRKHADSPPDLMQRLAKTDHALQHEYLLRHSTGYANATAQREAEAARAA